MTKNTSNTPDKKAIADKEYKRLTELYKSANADAVKLQAYDELIRKVADLHADIEMLKTLPLLIFDTRYPTAQKETAAGKARVKLMAQYVNAMQKLNKDLLGALNNDDDGDLDDYE